MARSRRGRNKRSQDNWGVILIVIAMTLVVIVGMWFFKEAESRVELDSNTNCPIKGANSVTAILIDTTDSLSRDQALYLNKKLSELVLNSETYDKFDIYFLNETTDKISPSISVCNPGDGNDKSELTNNKRRLKEVWKTTFFDKLSELFSTLREVPQADQSPIIEGIKFVSIDAFVGNEAKNKKLIVVSDLLQHSSLLSHYSDQYSENVAESSPISASFPYLEHVDVTLMYVVRPAYRQLQSNKHFVFWENLIRASGGNISSVELVK